MERWVFGFEADEIEHTLVHPLSPASMTIDKAKRGRNTLFSLEPKQVKTCYCVVFSLGVKPIDFNYR